MDNYSLSIIIATRGREYYCKRCIDVMLSFITEKTQIVISDNSESSDIANYVEQLNVDRIKYKHTGGELTMSENYNIGLSMASGDYICMLGDDDIVLPSIYNALTFAIENNADCITQSKVINYIWPLDKSNGTVYLPLFSGESKEINFKNNLISFFKEGCCVNPRDYSLPSIYHGLVKKDIVDKAYKLTGTYIDGISPDSYMAVILSQLSNVQYELDYPFSIGGACPSSATVCNMKGKYCGTLEGFKLYQMSAAKGYIWHPAIPKYYSVQTVWAESSLQADKNSELEQFFDLEKLTAHAIVENLGMTSFIMSETKKCNKRHKVNYFKLLCDVLGMILRKIKNRLFGSHTSELRKIDDIGEIDKLIEVVEKSCLHKQ